MSEVYVQILSLLAAVLALIISVVNMSRERKLEAANEELQRRQLVLQNEANRLQRATDELAKHQLAMSMKVLHEPYFALKWKALAPALKDLTRALRDWVAKSEASDDLLARTMIPMVSAYVAYDEIDWSYDPELKQLLQLLDGTLTNLGGVAVEHHKLCLLGDTSFWMIFELPSFAPEGATSGDARSYGVFESASGFKAYLDDLLRRLGMDGNQPALRNVGKDFTNVFAQHPQYQQMLEQSTAHMRDQLRQASSFARRLQHAIDVHDGKFASQFVAAAGQ